MVWLFCVSGESSKLFPSPSPPFHTWRADCVLSADSRPTQVILGEGPAASVDGLPCPVSRAGADGLVGPHLTLGLLPAGKHGNVARVLAPELDAGL